MIRKVEIMKIALWIKNVGGNQKISRVKFYERYIEVSGDSISRNVFYRELRKMGIRMVRSDTNYDVVGAVILERPNDLDPRGYVYFITDGEYVKIGSTADLKSRLNSLQTANARPLTLLKYVECKDRFETERQFHDVFSRFRVNGEWFNILYLFT